MFITALFISFHFSFSPYYHAMSHYYSSSFAPDARARCLLFRPVMRELAADAAYALPRVICRGFAAFTPFMLLAHILCSLRHMRRLILPLMARCFAILLPTPLAFFFALRRQLPFRPRSSVCDVAADAEDTPRAADFTPAMILFIASLSPFATRR